MEIDKCFICNTNDNTNNNFHQMTCNHFHCSKCLIRLIILKHLTLFQFNKPIKANCPCANVGFISLDINQIEQMLSKVSTGPLGDNRTLNQKPNETCPFHYNELNKMFCKDCLELGCLICFNRASHYQHQVVTKEEIINSLKSSIRNLPLQFRTATEFASSFAGSIDSFKSTINTYLNKQLAQIDHLISQLEMLKQEYITMTQANIAEWDKYLDVLKRLYSFYFDSYKQFETSDDLNELKFVNNIRNDFKKLKARVNNQNNEQMASVLHSIEEMITNTKNTFDIEIIYNELPQHYNICSKLIGHKGQIYAAIQLSDGHICTGGDDYTIRFWEKLEGKYKNTYTISEYTGEVVSLIQLNDRRIISCSKDNNAFRIWMEKDNSGKYSCGGTLSEHFFAVTSVYQLSDYRLMTTSKDHSIKLWATHQQLFQCCQTLKEHSQTVYCCIELMRKRLASASSDCSIRIWEEINGVFFSIQILKTQKKKMKTLTQLKDGLLVSGGKEGLILFWKENEDEAYECIYSITSVKSDVLSLVQLKNNRLVSLTKDGLIHLWMKKNNGIDGWNQIEELSVHKKKVLCVIELNEEIILSTTNDRIVYLWRNSFYLDSH